MLEAESHGWALLTMSSEEAQDLLLPVCSETLRWQSAEEFLLSPCPACHFLGKSKPGSTKDVGSNHPELAPLVCDLSYPKGPKLRRDPTSALPVLKWLIFLEEGIPHFVLCPTLLFFTGSCKLGSWSWAPNGMLIRKETYPPSFSFLPYLIHKQIVLLFPSTCFLLPSVSLPSHSPL